MTKRIKDEKLAQVLAGKERLLIDGGMGTMIMAAGLSKPGRFADVLNVENPEAITAIHRAYAEAGAEVITTNTFNTSSLHFPTDGNGPSVAEIFKAGAECARAAGARYVAGDIGPLGEMLEPYGDLEEDEAYELFLEEAKASVDADVDLILIETMMDLNEAELAIKAALEVADIPVFATMSFATGGRTMFGVRPEDEAESFAELGVDALGTNCSTGPEEMRAVIEALCAATDLPIIAQPNAGTPTAGTEGSGTGYAITPEDFADAVAALMDAGATIVGGCCGTNPDCIAALKGKL